MKFSASVYLALAVVTVNALPQADGQGLADLKVGAVQRRNAAPQAPDNSMVQKLADLQNQLQAAAQDPAKAQQIQQEMLNVMVQQQQQQSQGSLSPPLQRRDTYPQVPDNTLVQKLAALQGQLQAAAQDPSKAQQIQQEMLNVMVQQQQQQSQGVSTASSTDAPLQRRDGSPQAPDNNLVQKLADLQSQLQAAAQDPARAQQIQQEMLNVMVQQQQQQVQGGVGGGDASSSSINGPPQRRDAVPQAPDNSLVQKLAALQNQLQAAAQDPVRAQQIQQEMLNVMAQQQQQPPSSLPPQPQAPSSDSALQRREAIPQAPDNSLAQKLAALQNQLQAAAQDPSKAQQIQQEMLSVMVQHQQSQQQQSPPPPPPPPPTSNQGDDAASLPLQKRAAPRIPSRAAPKAPSKAAPKSAPKRPGPNNNKGAPKPAPKKPVGHNKTPPKPAPKTPGGHNKAAPKSAPKKPEAHNKAIPKLAPQKPVANKKPTPKAAPQKPVAHHKAAPKPAAQKPAAHNKPAHKPAPQKPVANKKASPKPAPQKPAANKPAAPKQATNAQGPKPTDKSGKGAAGAPPKPTPAPPAPPAKSAAELQQDAAKKQLRDGVIAQNAYLRSVRSSELAFQASVQAQVPGAGVREMKAIAGVVIGWDGQPVN